MSLIKYNDINLSYPLTTKFIQEAVDDEVGHVDWILTKFDIQAQYLINAEYIDVIAPQYANFNPTNAAAVMKQIRTDLLERRRLLSFIINGVQQIPARAGVVGLTDAKNGPTPISCEILQMTAETFLLNYHIVAHYWENYGVNKNTTRNNPSNPVLFNRWSETQELDGCQFSKRTREGTYMIRSDNVEGVTADVLRSKMAVVGVPDGFLRENSSYTISPDGLAIKYKVTDKEVFKMPPAQALEAEGEYRETATMNGAVRYGEVRIKLKGSKNSSQAALVETAVAIAALKLDINGARRTAGTGVGFSIVDFATIRVGMYENWVEFHIRAMMTGGKSRLDGVVGFCGPEGFSAAMVNTPGSSGFLPKPVYYDRGTAPLLLKAAAYYDPNLIDNSLNKGGPFTANNPITPANTNQMNKGKEPGTTGKDREI